MSAFSRAEETSAKATEVHGFYSLNAANSTTKIFALQTERLRRADMKIQIDTIEIEGPVDYPLAGAWLGRYLSG
tara:strand:- start:18250 stop:18471 length:222 start_codon:yes stop_codon:yes gene_type:complete